MITFLHTSPVHVSTFDRLLAQIAPDMPAVHLVDEALLADARRLGDENPDVVARVSSAVNEAAANGSSVVVCTCSTIGGIAERVETQGRFLAMRIDRPMADEAVRLGPSVLIVAALDSTLAPTTALVQSSADRRSLPVRVTAVAVPGAWRHFERGDMDAYLGEIAAAARAAASGHSVVVLAQASMAGAQALLADLGIPVLSSPRLGVVAAVHACNVRRSA